MKHADKGKDISVVVANLPIKRILNVMETAQMKLRNWSGISLGSMQRGTERSEDLTIHGKIILNCALNKWGEMMPAGFKCTPDRSLPFRFSEGQST
jgi:hypothetical protein